jgi:hypothetical protein
MMVTDGNPSSNFAHAENLIRQNPGASLYLLPELWTTGYDHASWKNTAVQVTPKPVYSDPTHVYWPINTEYELETAPLILAEISDERGEIREIRLRQGDRGHHVPQ